MRKTHRTLPTVAAMLAVSAGCALAQNWPQWRGVNRDGKAAGFTAPKTWPKELNQKWKVTVGLGDASPAVVGDELYVFVRKGTEEVIRCLEAANGKELWSDKYEAVQVSGTAYASPVILTVGGTRMVVTLTAKNLVGIGVTDGKLLWEEPFPAQGRAYNAATPIVEGQTVIYTGAGRGTRAVNIEQTADGFKATELWRNPDNGVQFNTPVLKAGQIYGLSQNGLLFCLDARDGKTLWTTELGGRGFGSIVDAGSVLLALTPKGELTVFEPSGKEYKKLAAYKVAETETYAYPVPADKGLFVKEKDALSFWTTD